MRFNDHLMRGQIVSHAGTVYRTNSGSGMPTTALGSLLLPKSTVFVIDNVASLLFGPDGGVTEQGENCHNCKELVGIVPPFENCLFEYAFPQLGLDFVGIQLITGKTLETFLSGSSGLCHSFLTDSFQPGAKHNFLAWSYVRFICDAASGRSLNFGPNALASFSVDAEGQIVGDGIHISGQEPDPNPIQRINRNSMTGEISTDVLPESGQYRQAKASLFLPALVSMMLISQKAMTTLSPEIGKSRQVRRHEQRHPTAEPTMPFSRYYTLDLEPFKPLFESAGTGKGGWHQAWHRVRGFLRHIKKSGKVVPVRPHSRGNPLIGVIQKDYAIRT